MSNRSAQRRLLIDATNRKIVNLTSFDRDYLILYLTENKILNKNQIAEILGMTRENVGRIIKAEELKRVVPTND